MNIDKRPSGNYRVRQMVNGKNYSVTVDHKPSEKEAHLLIADALARKGMVTSTDIPFKLAYKAYIESKADILSPSTIGSGYNSIIRQVSESFMNTPINKITKPMLQAEVNRYSLTRSPKSTDNFSGLIISVLKYFGNEIKGIKRPQKKPVDLYIPSEEEVHAVYEALKPTKYYVPLLLSGSGLRRSEICALVDSDLDGCILTIDKALVKNEHGEWVIKSTKTESSTRKIALDERLVEIINERGMSYIGNPEMINRNLIKAEEKLGLPHFSLHKMRHFFVSYLDYLGVPSKVIQKAGGWKTDHVMKTVYDHAMNVQKEQAAIASALGKLI